MGRTVINETENKQTIILNDSADGVTGGYFDPAMNWHDLGNSGNPYPIEITTDTPFFNFGAFQPASNHSTNGSYVQTSLSQIKRRIHAFNFSASFYPVVPGKKIKVTTPATYVALDFVDADGLKKVYNQESLADITWTSDWHTTTDNEVIIDPADYSDPLVPVAFVLTFKQNETGFGEFASLDEVLPLKMELV